MTLNAPTSMNDCVYFTNRLIGEKQVLAWVYRKQCPQCKKAPMGKPVENGKIKARAKMYVCPVCGHTEEKTAYEESLTLEAQYDCPECGKKGESTSQYKRKNYKGVSSYIIECAHCHAKIPLTKKLKGVK